MNLNCAMYRNDREVVALGLFHDSLTLGGLVNECCHESTLSSELDYFAKGNNLISIIP